MQQEKAKQDDGLSDLSDILGDLKSMAVDMGSEIDKSDNTNTYFHTVMLMFDEYLLLLGGNCRQNKALDHLGDDVDELNSRVQGANQRARHLLSK